MLTGPMASRRLLQAAAGFVFRGQGFVFEARDVFLRAKLAGFDAEIADAGGFEMFEVGGELGGLRGVAAAVLAQGIGFGAQCLELLFAFEQA